MKNLPESDYYNSLKRRLKEYQEEPEDDLWERLSAALPKTTGNSWGRLLAAASVIFLLSFISTDHAVKIAPEQLELSQTSCGGGPGESEERADKEKNVFERLTGDKVTDTSVTGKEPNRTYASIEYRTKKLTKDEVVEFNLRSTPATANLELPLMVNSGEDTLTMSMAQKPSVDTLLNDVLPGLPVKKLKSKAAIYASFNPALSFYNVRPIGGDRVGVHSVTFPSNFSVDRLAYGFELGVRYSIASHVECYTSLNYSHQQVKLGLDYYLLDEVNAQEGVAGQWEVEPSEGHQTLSYSAKGLGVGFGIMYAVRRRKIIQRLGTGLIYERTTVVLGNHAKTISDRLEWKLFAEHEFFASKDVHFFIQPTLTNTIKEDPIRDFPVYVRSSRAGMTLGLKYLL